MKKIMMTLAAVVCCTMISTMFTACGSKGNTAMQEASVDSTELVINLDSIVIKPYLEFGSSLADVEKYMTENFADYTAENTDSLSTITGNGFTYYGKHFTKDKNKIWFFFANEDGSNLIISSYDFFFPTQLEPIMAELESKGFVNKGEVKFDDYNADICYLLLSANEKLEVQVSSWEKDGGSWAISFQNTDENDLKQLVNK